MKFDSLEDIRQKVSNSLCLVDGEGPYWIGDVSARSFEVSDENGAKIINKDPRRVSFTPPVLGNIQAGNNAVYLSRKPVRRYKVGLSTDNCTPANLFRVVSVGDICRGLKDTQRNEYPAQKDYKHLVNTGFKVALSKRYSIDKSGVYYRGEVLAKKVGNKLVFWNKMEADYHVNNLMSLIQGYEYDYKETERVLKYGQDDI